MLDSVKLVTRSGVNHGSTTVVGALPRALTTGHASTAAKAAQHSANLKPDFSMQAVAERARKLAAKAIKEGKAGFVTDGKSVAIIER